MEVSDDEVKRRARVLYGKKRYALMVRDWELWEDPKEHRWSGYAEAVAKGGLAVEGLSKLFVKGRLSRGEVIAEYRQHLYIQGAERHHELTGELIKPGFKLLKAGMA